MSPYRLLRYDTVRRRLAGGSAPVSLLLGSGFSIDLDPRYGYPALLGSAFPNPRSRIRRLFGTARTTDFERLMSDLETAAAYAPLYGHHGSTTASYLQRDISSISAAFRRALAATHHGSVDEIPDTRYGVARSFLSFFGNVFSLNYDLLLYWALNRASLSGSPPRDDGFLPDRTCQLAWAPGNPQHVYWLHGGLHLFPSRSTVTKLAYTATGRPLLSEILTRVSAGIYPLVVLEGTTSQKLHAIGASAYLQHAYDALLNLQGVLILFGVGVSPQDGHIRDAILNSGLSAVAVGIYPGSTSVDQNAVVATWAGLAALRLPSHPLAVHCFDSTTAPVW